jgi:hypothetical protein
MADDDSNVLDMKRKPSIREMFDRTAGKPGPDSAPRSAGKATRKERHAAGDDDAEQGEPFGGPESFDPDSSDYKAFGWAGNRGLPSLRVILKDGSEHACHYADLDTAHPDGSVFKPSITGHKGNVITLRFAGRAKPFLVIIEGLRLRQVWELLIGHRTPWIHELPTAVSFARDDEPVIRSITFKQIAAEG